MRKLGKKLSYFTKVLLVLSLFFSNLSGLSVVFAYENAENFVVTLSENNEIVVDYQKELDETDVVKVTISESYTYLENVDSITKEPVSEEVLGSVLLAEEGAKFNSDILSTVLFDGLYEGKVTLYNVTDETDLGTISISSDVVNESGLEVKLFDMNDSEITELDEDMYYVNEENSEVYASMKILAGGLKPTDKFEYDGTLYSAEDILEKTFNSDVISFDGRLYGEYTEEVSVSLELNEEEVTFSSEVVVSYGLYDQNFEVLYNAISELGLEDMYGITFEEEDGELYVLLDGERASTLLDLYNIAISSIGDSEEIDFVISNSEYDDVLKAYEELNETLTDNDDLGVAPVNEESLDEENPEEITKEKFLEGILIDDSVVLTFISGDVTIRLETNVIADLNNDSKLDEEDLLLLIDQVIGKEEAMIEKADIFDYDGEVSVLDFAYLVQIIKNNSWNVGLLGTELESIDARLDLLEEDIVTGDEITVNYVLTLDEYMVNGIAGTVKYDDTMLELVSVVANEKFVGNSHEGNFLYYTEEGFVGTLTLEEEEEIYKPTEYIMITAKFGTLKSGVTTISIENPEYLNEDGYYDVQNEISTLVMINESDDNTLSKLTVAGQEIELVEDVLEYEIVVGNEVTSSLVEAITSNIAANVTSIVAPEELVEGDNIITIFVTAENGDEKVYTVTVIREAAVKEEEDTTATSMNYQENYTEDSVEDDNDKTVVVEEEDTDNDDTTEEEKEQNVSRIIIIILILLVIAGLIYLIFKDDKEEDDSRKVNKDINKLKNNKDFENKKSSKNNKKGR